MMPARHLDRHWADLDPEPITCVEHLAGSAPVSAERLGSSTAPRFCASPCVAAETMRAIRLAVTAGIPSTVLETRHWFCCGQTSREVTGVWVGVDSGKRT